MDNDRKMKDAFITKSEEEYKKLLKQYEEEKDNYEIELDNLKIVHE